MNISDVRLEESAHQLVLGRDPTSQHRSCLPPRPTDRVCLKLTNCFGALDEVEEEQVRSRLARVAEPIRVRWRGDDSRYFPLLVWDELGKLFAVTLVDRDVGGWHARYGSQVMNHVQ